MSLNNELQVTRLRRRYGGGILGALSTHAEQFLPHVLDLKLCTQPGMNNSCQRNIARLGVPTLLCPLPWQTLNPAGS